MIVGVGVVLNPSIVHTDSFDNLCGSRLQSQNELHHVRWWYQTLDSELTQQDGRGRRGQTLCDKRDHNFAKLHFPLNRSFWKRPGNIDASEDREKTRK